MEIVLYGMAIAIGIVLVIPLAYLVYRNQKLTESLKRLKDELKKLEKEPTYDARQLLHDLMDGSTVVRITRLDPSELYVRRT